MIRIKQIVPFPLTGDDLAARAMQVPTNLRSDTIVDIATVKNSFVASAPGVGTTYYEWAILEMYVVEAGLSAEDDGYDAVVVDTTTDSGVTTLRSRLTIPVIGAGSTGYGLASMLGRTFAVITYTDAHRFLVDDALRSTGWKAKCVSIQTMGKEPVLVGTSADLIEEDVRLLTNAGWNAVRDGAEVVVLGSTTMHPLAGALADELPVPVIDPGSTAIALAELLVASGLAHGKAAYPAPGLLQDAVFRALPAIEGWLGRR